ncbi:MAG: hypothetical protein NVS1B4_16510 [Gemmatimonadaceae bacterium]
MTPPQRPFASSVSPVSALEDTLSRAGHVALRTAELAFTLPEPSASRWHRAGVSERGERIFNIASGLVLTMFTVGWTWTIARAQLTAERDGGVTDATASIASALTTLSAPSAAFLTEAALETLLPLRGSSGKLRARIQSAGTPILTETARARLPEGSHITFSGAGATESTAVAVAPRRPGVWKIAVAAKNLLRPITDLSVITLRPFADKRGGRIGLYYIGAYPAESSRRGNGRRSYASPSGFIEVTENTAETPVSEHFKLGDFLTHDQEDVWPKYLVLDMKLVDKLELVLDELAARGIDTRGVRVMSGFRTPAYNSSGGDPKGRAALSRHMYGDAADIYIDNSGVGRMNDLNHDGRVDLRDAAVIRAAVDRVESRHPELVGGCGIYPGTAAHGPFTHIDARGFRARWIGTGTD